MLFFYNLTLGADRRYDADWIGESVLLFDHAITTTRTTTTKHNMRTCCTHAHKMSMPPKITFGKITGFPSSWDCIRQRDPLNSRLVTESSSSEPAIYDNIDRAGKQRKHWEGNAATLDASVSFLKIHYFDQNTYFWHLVLRGNDCRILKSKCPITLTKIRQDKF